MTITEVIARDRLILSAELRQLADVEAKAGSDLDLTVESRRDRAQISEKSAIRAGDKIQVEGTAMEVLGPGRGVDAMLTAWTEADVLHIGTVFVDQLD